MDRQGYDGTDRTDDIIDKEKIVDFVACVSL